MISTFYLICGYRYVSLIFVLFLFPPDQSPGAHRSQWRHLQAKAGWNKSSRKLLGRLVNVSLQTFSKSRFVFTHLIFIIYFFKQCFKIQTKSVQNSILHGAVISVTAFAPDPENTYHKNKITDHWSAQSPEFSPATAHLTSSPLHTMVMWLNEHKSTQPCFKL